MALYNDHTKNTILYMEGCAHMGIMWAETVEDRIAQAGYSALHAPEATAYHQGRVASAMRRFDASGGKTATPIADWIRDFGDKQTQ